MFPNGGGDGVNVNADINALVATAKMELTKPFTTTNTNTNKLCHGAEQPMISASPRSFDDIKNNRIAVVGLSMNTPVTLLNSMLSWDKSGLLDLAHEKLMILNQPHPAELGLAYDYGFKVLQPKDISDVKLNPKYDNVVTIGAAFYYALREVESDYVVFLEKDFMADYTMGKERFAKAIAEGVQLLEEGAWIVRLRSKSQQGCDSFKGCGKGKIDFDTTFTKNRRINHWQFYCDDYDKHPEYVAQCLEGDVSDPEDRGWRCHTSYDSNWSLNAVIVKKSVMMKQKPVGGRGSFPSSSLADFGLSTFNKQDGMEVRLGDDDWYSYKIPICFSVNGAFFHAEIDG
jgi:hypothetical protein